MTKQLKIYLGIIYILALLSFIFSSIIYRNGDMVGFYDFTAKDILIFIITLAIAESLIIKYPPIAISTGFAVTTASLIGFGIFGGILVVIFGVAFRVVKHNGRYNHIFNTPLYKTLFNVSALTISAFISGCIYYKLLGSLYTTNLAIIFIKFILLSFSFLIVNSIIISNLVYILTTNTIYINILMEHLKLGFLNIVFVSPLGLILIILYNSLNVLGILAIIIPVILLRHIFQLYIQ